MGDEFKNFRCFRGLKITSQLTKVQVESGKRATAVSKLGKPVYHCGRRKCRGQPNIHIRQGPIPTRVTVFCVFSPGPVPRLFAGDKMVAF